jgi:aspartate kinase
MDFSVITFTVTTSPSGHADPSSPTRSLTPQAGQEHIKPRRIVVKFGGSSLADKDRIERAARLIAAEVKKNTRLVVVVSAMGKTTDQLLSLVNHDSGEMPDKTDIDDVLSMGERTSVRVFATALKRQGLDARYFDPTDLEWPIITDNQFSNANPILELCVRKVREHVSPLLEQGRVPVIAGFVGRSANGKISTIGRGGSDTTAFIIGRGIDADEVVLVTDAEGILSADPKVIPNARKLDRIDVGSLIGLADSESKFIHRKALRYKDPNIQARVISHRKDDLDADGTVVTGGIASEIDISLASDAPSMSVTVAGKRVSENPAIMQSVAAEIKNHSTLLGLSADFDSIIFYVPQHATETLLGRIHDMITAHKETLAMAVQRDLAFFKIRGVGLEDTPGIIGKISTRLLESKINIFGMLTLASSILVFVSWQEKEQALNVMKEVITREEP